MSSPHLFGRLTTSPRCSTPFGAVYYPCFGAFLCIRRGRTGGGKHWGFPLLLLFLLLRHVPPTVFTLWFSPREGCSSRPALSSKIFRFRLQICKTKSPKWGFDLATLLAGIEDTTRSPGRPIQTNYSVRVSGDVRYVLPPTKQSPLRSHGPLTMSDASFFFFNMGVFFV